MNPPLTPYARLTFEPREVAVTDRQDRERHRLVGQIGRDAGSATARRICAIHQSSAVGAPGSPGLALDLACLGLPRRVEVGDLEARRLADVVLDVDTVAETDEHRLLGGDLGEHVDLHVGPADHLGRRHDGNAVGLDRVRTGREAAVRSEDRGSDGESGDGRERAKHREHPAHPRTHRHAPLRLSVWTPG